MANRVLTTLRNVRRRLADGSADPDPGSERYLAMLSEADRAVVERVSPYTLTGVERIGALIDAVRYCVRRDVPGALAECGVWMGGSILAMLLVLEQEGADDRDVYLFDTFEGMTRPGEHDTSPFEAPALASWSEAEKRNADVWWAGYFDPENFDEDAVRKVVLSTAYPEQRIHFVTGPVERTIPAPAPERLALLRLDTDWYESTRHELVHLYPRLSSGGVLIVDDYGHWDGARRAVDEYFGAESDAPLLSRIDYGARLAVKP